MRHSGTEGLVAAPEEEWEALILDVMMSGMKGFELLRELIKTSQVPALMLTAMGEEADRIVGMGVLLLSGLVWFPFVRRVTRRLRVMTDGAERISEGDFEVSVASHRGDEIGRLSRVI